MSQIPPLFSFDENAECALDGKLHLPSHIASFPIIGEDQIGMTLGGQTDRGGLTGIEPGPQVRKQR